MTKADIPRLATITTARGMPHLLEGELSGPGSGPPARHRTQLRPPTRRRRSSCLSALPRSPRYGSTVADLRGKVPFLVSSRTSAPSSERLSRRAQPRRTIRRQSSWLHRRCSWGTSQSPDKQSRCHSTSSPGRRNSWVLSRATASHPPRCALPLRSREPRGQQVRSINETDLTKAAIRSPVDGVVLSRNVEPGQTVAASFQAPGLFKIAQDLRRMELHVDVDEADVSRVRKGQAATFTVDAYPDRSFPATIREVSFASKTVEGVVTYEGVPDGDNGDLLL